MQAFIAVMGILVTLIVVAGMILLAPSGTEPNTPDAVDGPGPVNLAPVPLAGEAPA